jgi:peptidyl-prolyl cis-trans isomerase B (cyclophilin B)
VACGTRRRLPLASAAADADHNTPFQDASITGPFLKEGARVASKISRQRKLERARAERRLARQAQHARRKRQIQAGIAASLALVLIVLGVTWALGGFSSKPDTANNVASSCLWVPKNPTSSAAGSADTGTPSAGELRSGFETMTIKTNLGDITAQLDLTKAPCAAASFKFLGEKAFFNGSNCHRLNTDAKTLTCGDPHGDGTGGPSYQFADEDVPTAPLAKSAATPSTSPGATSTSPGATTAAAGASYYAKGTIVMVNTGANTNGSQFTIVYGDASTLAAAYSIVGTVTTGLDIVEKVAQGGVINTANQPAVEGKPKTTLTIQQLTVAVPGAPSATVAPSPTSAASAAAH